MKHVLVLSFLTLLLGGCELLRPEQKAVLSGEQAAETSLAEAVVGRVVDQEPVLDSYGVAERGMEVTVGKVGRRETLADVLLPLGLNMQEIYQISLLPDTVIDERRIKPGNAWKFYASNDSIAGGSDARAIAPESRIFVYEKDPLNFVRIYLDSAGIRGLNGQKVVDHRIQFTSGTIENSLWADMQASNANPILAVELSEIYAWSIDFFGIQAGDEYKVVYEESFVDERSIGVRRVIGAWIKHSGHEFWAIPFVQDSVRSFYDEEGNSLRKAFLKAPLSFSRISSGFSNSRYHPVLKRYRPHHGVDYAARTGTPVQSIGDGVIIKRGYQARGGGNYIKIRHNSVYSTSYMHLHGFAKGMTVGKFVKQGETIGYVGSTGLSTGPHLDFRFYMNGSPVNPLKVEAPPVEPVHENNLAAYAVSRAFTMSLLNLL